jgi:hypothetical protein
LWFSTDSTTGPAPRVEGARHRLLQVHDEQPPEGSGVELVFRTRRREGRLPATQVGLALVCPAYKGLHVERGGYVRDVPLLSHPESDWDGGDSPVKRDSLIRAKDVLRERD